MSAPRFAAGVGAGVALAALLAGAANLGAPAAAEPEGAAPAVERRSAVPAAPAPARAPKDARVERGVLARAAASRRSKAAPASGTPGVAAERASGSREAVVDSVEVDWGGAPARP